MVDFFLVRTGLVGVGALILARNAPVLSSRPAFLIVTLGVVILSIFFGGVLWFNVGNVIRGYLSIFCGCLAGGLVTTHLGRTRAYEPLRNARSLF